MSRELDTTMQLSEEEWAELSPHLRTIMLEGQEEAFKTFTNQILSNLTESPELRHRLQMLLYEPLGFTLGSKLMQFITMAEARAFERAIRRGTRLVEGGYAEWEKLDEEGSVSFHPQCFDPLRT